MNRYFLLLLLVSSCIDAVESSPIFIDCQGTGRSVTQETLERFGLFKTMFEDNSPIASSLTEDNPLLIGCSPEIFDWVLQSTTENIESILKILSIPTLAKIANAAHYLDYSFPLCHQVLTQKLKERENLEKFIQNENYLALLNLHPTIALQIGPHVITHPEFRSKLLSYISLSKMPAIAQQDPIFSAYAVCWCPDQTKFATISLDNTVSIRDAGSGETLQKIETDAYNIYLIDKFSWNKDGTFLAFGSSTNKRICIWNVATKSPDKIIEFKGAVYGLAWRSDNVTLAYSKHDKTIEIWNLKTKEVIACLKQDVSSKLVSWSPDGQFLASEQPHGIITIWDTEKWDPSYLSTGHTRPISIIDWSPDGKSIVSSAGKEIRICNLNQETPIKILKGHKKKIFSLCWNPDGTLLASAAYDNTVRIWDVVSGQCIHILPRDKKGTGWLGWISNYIISWSPDGRTLVSGIDNVTPCLWDVTNLNAMAAHFFNTITLPQALLLEFLQYRSINVHHYPHLEKIFLTLPEPIQHALTDYMQWKKRIFYATKTFLLTIPSKKIMQNGFLASLLLTAICTFAQHVPHEQAIVSQL